MGSAKNIKLRLNRHKYYLNKGEHYNAYLQNAWNKYGEFGFEFEILDYCELDELLFKEQYYIDRLKPVYNIRKIAESNLGLKHSEETKEKMRANGNKGKKMTGQALDNIRKGAKNRVNNTTDKVRKAAKENMTRYNKSDKHKKVAAEVGKIYGPKNIKKAHDKKREKFEVLTPKIFELREKGLLGKEIAEKLGISLITVRRKLNNKRYSRT